MIPCLLAVALAAGEGAMVAVAASAEDSRAAVTIEAPGAEPLGVRRSGDEVIVTLQGELPPELALPAAIAPIQSVSVERQDGRVVLRVRVAAATPFEVRRMGASLTVLFGQPPALQLARAVQPELQALYQRLWPGFAGPVVPMAPGVAPPAYRQRSDIGLGPLRFRPYIVFAYTDGTFSYLDTPQPAKGQFLQVQPSLGAYLDLPIPALHLGTFSVSYTPRFRGLTSIEELKQVSHELVVTGQVPLSSLSFDVSDRHFWGTQESTEVDPGREYFFNLAGFHRRETRASARWVTGGPLSAELGGYRNTVDFGEGGFPEQRSFFGFEQQGLSAGLRYDLGAKDSYLRLDYLFGRIPPPAERPEAESRAHTLQLGVRSEVMPLLTATGTVGYTRQSYPNAALGGRDFNGITYGLGLLKEFTRGLKLNLGGSRTTYPSGFESNGFYVSRQLSGGLSIPVPLSFVISGGGAYQWNDYRTNAAELGVPRTDRIRGWSVGAGRALTSHGFLRADYRRERRFSNLSDIGNESEGFTLQLGFGLFGAPAGRQ